MNLIGLYLEQALLNNKYNIQFADLSFSANINRLTNQIWKLIPMRENNEDWFKQLETVVLEIAGLGEIFLHNPLFLQLLSKLEGLLVIETSFEMYRKTVFETISLIQQIKKEYNNE